MYIPRRVAQLVGISLSLFVLVGLWAAPPGSSDSLPPPFGSAVHLDRGAAGLARCLKQLKTRASFLMINAHPDDEDGGMLAYETRGLGARGALMSLTRGEGGQNAMSLDFNDALGVLRTQELLSADQFYGVDQYWSSVIDYGFSKTREEADSNWGHERVLGDVVRVIRLSRPLVLNSVFAGAPTDGHGNHQISGQMAQEAFEAAGDPKRFPEQLKEGLRPWTPLKVYERVPFFSETKEGIYDYATDKYVPVRFFDYVHAKWINSKPASNLEIPEGTMGWPAGYTFLQMAREGLGQQKSQNGGVTIPEPSFSSVAYHRYGSRVPAADQEKSFFDGIDISLGGIATLAHGGDEGFLKTALSQLTTLVDSACTHFHPDAPAEIAPALAQGLTQVRALIAQTESSSLPEQGKQDVLFELHVKEQQFAEALTLSLGLSLDASVAAEKENNGPFGGAAPTFTNVIPGQSFAVQAHLLNAGNQEVAVQDLQLANTDGKAWTLSPQAKPPSSLAGSKDLRVRFRVTVPENADVTKPFYSRPDEEQPFYNLDDPRFRNLSNMPYPLAAVVQIGYRGATWSLKQYVQSRQRIEGIGLISNPLTVAPAMSVMISPGAGAVPLTSEAFNFSCTLQSNVKGPAKGSLRLQLPDGWSSTPAATAFEAKGDGDTQTVSFQIHPGNIKPQRYDIRAVIDYAGKSYSDGFRLVGYPGLRPYPFYRAAVYKAVGVDVTTAPNLHVAFIPGTGDEVPRALEDLGLSVRVIPAAELQSASLDGLDTIVLGVRAYAAQPALRASKSRLLEFVKNGGTLVVQYNTQNFGSDDAPYSLDLGSNPAKVVDETSAVKLISPTSPVLSWPNRITAEDFGGWEEERGHGFLQKWDSRYEALTETSDPDQAPQKSGLLLAHYGKGIYIYDAYALYRQLPAGVPGAYRLLANLVSAGKNPRWK
jgi:LmbE family N-acetylglucosaminyl deacetylase